MPFAPDVGDAPAPGSDDSRPFARGEGWLFRCFGLTCDNVRAANVVTASGDIVRASEHAHADLLWALCGGGGNFGVVTSFEFRLHPVGPDVVAGQVIYPVQQAEELLRLDRDRFRNAPDALTCYPFFFRFPPVDPQHRAGRLNAKKPVCERRVREIIDAASPAARAGVPV